MSKKTPWQEMFTRRAIFFGGVNAAVASVLVSRLYYLQFIRAEDYKTLAEGNRVKLQIIAPHRGNILDRNGVPLAMNQKNYQALIDIDPKADTRGILNSMSRIVEVSPEKIQEILDQAKRRRYLPPQLIKEHLTWEELSKIEYHTLDLPGVFIDEGQVRFYPMADKAAHLTGYVGAVAEKEVEASEARENTELLEGEVEENKLLKLPGFKIGKDGAEKFLEGELRGAAGVRQVEVNVHNLPVRELSTRESKPGKPITSTIDMRLQEFAANRLGDESGAIVVLDITNGDVLALVSMPAFDPNRFSMGITTNYWKELNANEKNPLLNKAIAGQYPPGSTFKMITGLAALDSKVANVGTSVPCPGHFFLGNHRFNCWKPEGHGHMNIHSAIAQSCDTYFYTMAQRMGIDPIARIARKFGLGTQTLVGLPNEKTGIVPDKEWKQNRYKQSWQAGDTINVAIGQGYIIATPMQLALMTARIANAEKMVMPRLLHDDTAVAQYKGLEIDPEHLKHIHIGMEMAVNHQTGTAYGKRIKDPRLSMAGKTGTSQVRKITVRGQDQDKLPWNQRHHAWFVGYAPLDKPKYAVSVLVEHGGGGSSAAAPVAKDVLEKVQRLAAEDAGIVLDPLPEGSVQPRSWE